MRKVILMLLLTFVTNTAKAESSKDYSMMGKIAWSAFECSSLASVAEDEKEQRRLFMIGYEQGKQFLDALIAKKINQSDLSSIVPSGFVMLIEGPTPDFVLGRLFAATQENALDGVFVSEGKYNPKDLQKIIAERRFHERNCRLIGLTNK